jgi:isopenicillin-N N-acyltransferase-like protein
MLKIDLPAKTPEQVGRAHGETFKKQIRELYEIRYGLLRKFLKGWSAAEIEVPCLESHKALEAHPELFQEFTGIHQASGLTAVELMILNNYTDLRDFSGNDEAPVEDGCSAVSLHSPRLRWAGQTWDMHASATPYTLLMNLADGTRVLTITGCLGLAGFNSSGFSVLINNMHCREFTARHIPWPALVRILLKSKTAGDAAKLLQGNLPCSGHNYLLCDEKNSLNIETTGIRSEITGQVRESNGFLLHTNHYLGSLKKVEIAERQSPTTHRRMSALEKYFQSKPLMSFNEAEIKKEVFVDGEVAAEVCIPADPKDPHKAMTCGGIFVNYTTRQFEAFGGLYKDGDIVRGQF